MAEVATTQRVQRKRRPSYHHGDLRRALLEAAVRIIEHQGIDALTLRSVGHKVGVSRTALYRHFADKTALLAAVAGQGFRTLRLQLVEAWQRDGGGHAGFDAMGLAYVEFARAHPAHYRVMFGGFVEDATDPELAEEGGGAFQALVDALVAQQQAGIVRDDNPLQLAQFIWATVHGIAMLAIDGLLKGVQGDPEALTRFALARLRNGIGSAESRTPKAESPKPTVEI